MPGKKPAFKNRGSLVNEVAKLEQTKDQANVNAFRQAFRRLIQIDAQATIDGFRAPITMLRKESLALVKKKQSK